MERKKIKLSDLAQLVQGELQGDADLPIRAFAPLETAEQGDISFLVKAKNVEQLQATKASAVLVPLAVEEAELPVVRVRDPYLASALIHNFLLEKPFQASGVHSSAHIGSECEIPSQVSIAPLAVIGERVCLGQRVVIESGVVVGDDVRIGDDTTLKANVTVAERCEIGNRVTVHSGTVIGSDGYGYAPDEQGHHIKRPQVGIVRIDDDVEIGANCCVDRATFGVTWIKEGVKIDNLVQVAHNVTVGEHSLLVAQVGVAGSSTLGRNVVIGAKVGVNGHITLGDQVMVAAMSGVHNNLSKGQVVAGVPAIAHRKWLRAAAVYAKLPDIAIELRENRRALAGLIEKDSGTE